MPVLYHMLFPSLPSPFDPESLEEVSVLDFGEQTNESVPTLPISAENLGVNTSAIKRLEF